MSEDLVRIVPDGPNCQGTKVLLPSGEALPGVRKITLTAERNALWQAVIEVNASPDEIQAQAKIEKHTGATALEVADMIVLEVPGALHPDGRAWLQRSAEAAWPGREVIILGDGIRVSREEQLQRIEEKLDRLLNQAPEEGRSEPSLLIVG